MNNYRQYISNQLHYSAPRTVTHNKREAEKKISLPSAASFSPSLSGLRKPMPEKPFAVLLYRFVDFKMSLRMGTCRTYLRSFGSLMEVTAVSAAPYNLVAALEYLAFHQIGI